MNPSPDPSVAAAARRAKPRKQRRQTKKRVHATPPPNVVGAFSISQFLAAHGGMSPAMYFKLKKADQGPKEMRVGRRIMISFEAAADWRRKREEASSSNQ